MCTRVLDGIGDGESPSEDAGEGKVSQTNPTNTVQITICPVLTCDVQKVNIVNSYVGSRSF